MKYPNYPLREQVRLGPTEEHVVGVQLSLALEAALRVWNWYCDGVILLPNELLIIEAKVHPDPAAVGQVLFYRELANSTPDFQPYLSIPFYPLVLYAEDDSGVSKFARRMGCRVEVYTPPWIADYLQLVQFRRRSSASGGSAG